MKTPPVGQKSESRKKQKRNESPVKKDEAKKVCEWSDTMGCSFILFLQYRVNFVSPELSFEWIWNNSYATRTLELTFIRILTLFTGQMDVSYTHSIELPVLIMEFVQLGNRQ